MPGTVPVPGNYFKGGYMYTNHSLLVVLKKAGEAAIKTTGNPAVIVATGIALSIVIAARALAESSGR
jgi:hypothetical protein